MLVSNINVAFHCSMVKLILRQAITIWHTEHSVFQKFGSRRELTGD